MPTFTKPKPSDPMHSVLAEATERFHGDLIQHKVTVGLLIAWPNESGDPPVKLHGYTCAAVIKITPYRQRVQGIEDAVITVDGQAWKDLDSASRLALMDHELTHLELACDEDGLVKSDDALRPKLKLRLHDWQLGGFAVIAGRHGPAALESQMFHAAYKDFYQQVFSWGDDMSGVTAEEMTTGARDAASAVVG